MIDENDLKKIEDIFSRHVGILAEDFQRKLDIVVEGHQLLHEKIERLERGQKELFARVDRIELTLLKMEKRLTNLERRMDNMERRMDNMEQGIKAVAADLAAHRADTEMHGTGYRAGDK
ncbi:MAG: hypothetical protein AB1847_03760 [bacterium]